MHGLRRFGANPDPSLERFDAKPDSNSLSLTGLSGKYKPKYRADAELALHGHHPFVSLDESLDDGQTKAQAVLPFGVRLVRVEHGAEAILRYALAIVAHETLGATLARHARPDDDLSARGVGDRVSDQVLEHTSHQAGIGVDNEVLRNQVDHQCRVCPGYRVEIVNKGFNQWPQANCRHSNLTPTSVSRFMFS